MSEISVADGFVAGGFVAGGFVAGGVVAGGFVAGGVTVITHLQVNESIVAVIVQVP